MWRYAEGAACKGRVEEEATTIDTQAIPYTKALE
jgi:hypothetical protein